MPLRIDPDPQTQVRETLSETEPDPQVQTERDERKGDYSGSILLVTITC